MTSRILTIMSIYPIGFLPLGSHVGWFTQIPLLEHVIIVVDIPVV